MDTTNKQIQTMSAPREKGATMVEYALLVALMSIGCMTVTSLMSYRIGQTFEDVAMAFGGQLF